MEATKLKALLEEGKAITARAKSERRELTNPERSRLDEILAKSARHEVSELTKRIAGSVVIGGDSKFLSDNGEDGWARIASSLCRGKSLSESGHQLSSVEVPLKSVTAEPKGKALVAFAGDKDEFAFKEQGITPLLADTRRAYQAFFGANPGEALAVSDFRQTGTRDVTGSVERDLTATTEKAILDVSVDVVSEDLKQMAIVIDEVPNALLEAEASLRGFLATEMQLQLDIALDAHVLGVIDAANPPFGSTGTGIAEQLRHAKAAMQAAGANPSVAIIKSTDSVTLDLTTEIDMPRGFPYGLEFIVVPDALLPEGAYVVDPRIAGRLYKGNLKVESDPYSGFKQNTTDLRGEFSALMVVRNAAGIYRIGAAE